MPAEQVRLRTTWLPTGTGGNRSYPLRGPESAGNAASRPLQVHGGPADANVRPAQGALLRRAWTGRIWVREAGATMTPEAGRGSLPFLRSSLDHLPRLAQTVPVVL